MNPITFRGVGPDGKSRNLTVGRLALEGKQRRTVIPDGQHSLDPGNMKSLFCPVILWNDGAEIEPLASAVLDESEFTTLVKDVLSNNRLIKVVKGPAERGSKTINEFAMRKIVDKVICRLCKEGNQDIDEALGDSLVIDLCHFTNGMKLLFPEGEF